MGLICAASLREIMPDILFAVRIDIQIGAPVERRPLRLILKKTHGMYILRLSVNSEPLEMEIAI